MRKEALYRAVGRIRAAYAVDRFPADSRALVMAACKSPKIETLPFSDPRIGGVLCRGANVTRVALNALHSGARQNFFCAHEFMHYRLHGDKEQMWICREPEGSGVLTGANASAEWEANAGAAELLVPYTRIIPAFADALSVRRPFFREQHLRALYEALAREYGVSDTVMEYRIKELVCEIMQYVSGTPVENVTVLSRAEQIRRGIAQYAPLSVYARIHGGLDDGDPGPWPGQRPERVGAARPKAAQT